VRSAGPTPDTKGVQTMPTSFTVISYKSLVNLAPTNVFVRPARAERAHKRRDEAAIPAGLPFTFYLLRPTYEHGYQPGREGI
jgi:hypothetical protein